MTTSRRANPSCPWVVLLLLLSICCTCVQGQGSFLLQLSEDPLKNAAQVKGDGYDPYSDGVHWTNPGYKHSRFGQCTGIITAIWCKEDDAGQIEAIGYQNSMTGFQDLGCFPPNTNWTNEFTRALFLETGENVIAVGTCGTECPLESVTFYTDKGQNMTCGQQGDPDDFSKYAVPYKAYGASAPAAGQPNRALLRADADGSEADAGDEADDNGAPVARRMSPDARGNRRKAGGTRRRRQGPKPGDKAAPPTTTSPPEDKWDDEPEEPGSDDTTPSPPYDPDYPSQDDSNNPAEGHCNLNYLQNTKKDSYESHTQGTDSPANAGQRLIEAVAASYNRKDHKAKGHPKPVTTPTNPDECGLYSLASFTLGCQDGLVCSVDNFCWNTNCTQINNNRPPNPGPAGNITLVLPDTFNFSCPNSADELNALNAQLQIISDGVRAASSGIVDGVLWNQYTPAACTPGTGANENGTVALGGTFPPGQGFTNADVKNWLDEFARGDLCNIENPPGSFNSICDPTIFYSIPYTLPPVAARRLLLSFMAGQTPLADSGILGVGGDDHDDGYEQDALLPA